jgi:transposase
MSQHYGTAIMPARPRKPRDKAKVENGVLVAERWILAALRHRKFFSLAELNEAIATLLERLNHRPFRKREGTRASLFAEVDRPALQPLPAERYVMAEWKTVRASIDYHVEIDRHYYSVPISWRASSWKPGPRLPPSRSSMPASALLLISAVRPRIVTPPSGSTCRRATRRIWSGRRRG